MDRSCPVTPKTCDNHGQRDKQTERTDKLEVKIGNIF